MTTCTSCGHDVSGKKFCPDCGTPVQVEQGTMACPRCSGSVRIGAAFCMHCGSSLHAQATTAASQANLRQCPACHIEVSAGSAFCTNCGQSMQTTQTPAPGATVPSFCGSCGAQNNPGARFCNSCGQALTSSAAPQTGPYPSYTPQYGQQPPVTQPPYNTGYPPQQPYAQGNYDPMLGQQPMALRCPVCMAMAPVGTPNCLSCHTSLAGVVPAPAAMQGQQQGSFGNMMQGNAGKYAMGALGGAAAVIGGEMLLHGIERDFEGRRDYDDWRDRRDRDDGLLGGLGNLGNDIGLF